MKRVVRIGSKVKAKADQIQASTMEHEALDTKVAVVHNILQLGVQYVQELLSNAVESVAGPLYQRKGQAGNVRWTKQGGWVYIGDQKVRVNYQRVRNKTTSQDVPLTVYEQLQQPRGTDEQLLRKVVHGLSCRRYEECSELVPGVFGLSAGAVSQRFIRASARKFRELQERRLEGYDLVAVLLDGKVFGTDEVVIALGITITGEKVILGFVQTGSENAVVCGNFLNELIERGLQYKDGLLFVIDGSKGFYKAIQKVFNGQAVVQRCQWHKRENVVSYLPKHEQATYRRRLQRAYEQSNYESAKVALRQVERDIRLLNESAANSLKEGQEETLTLHRLGLFEELGRNFKTTNCMESLMSLVGQHTDKVDHWKNSNQKQRWLATTLLIVEPRLNKISGYKHLKLLRIAVQNELKMPTVNTQAA
jgi:transposase-like protein